MSEPAFRDAPKWGITRRVLIGIGCFAISAGVLVVVAYSLEKFKEQAKRENWMTVVPAYKKKAPKKPAPKTEAQEKNPAADKN